MPLERSAPNKFSDYIKAPPTGGVIDAITHQHQPTEQHQMNREMALPYIAYCIDDALSERVVTDMPPNARLVGWQCGFEPMFVAVWSYLPDTSLTDDEAAELATNLLAEKNWFGEGYDGDIHEPDYII
jgi:hypothetical protein